MLQEVRLVSTPNYLRLLKACHTKKALHHVHNVHTDIICHGVLFAGLLGDYLIVTYAKCGALSDARFISCKLPHRTVFSWSSLISAYADCGRSLEALQLHQCMVDEGIQPNDYSFVGLLKACANMCNLELGRKLHLDICIKGFTSDLFVGNTLVSMYGKCGKTAEAEDVFRKLVQRDVISWTAIISAYVEVGLGEEALLAFRQMQEENVSANKTTLVVFLQACCCLAEREGAAGEEGFLSTESGLEIGLACHVDACRLGFMPDVLFLNTLVTFYSKCGAIEESEAVLGTLRHPHIVTWNAMLSAYIRQSEGKKALLLFKKMHEEGATPELHTIVFALQACNILADDEDGAIVEEHCTIEVALQIGVCLHEDACRKGCTSDVFVGTALLSMYGKVGRVSDAEDVFFALSHHDLASCNAMLALYAEQGQGNKALQFYRQMCQEGMSPNQLTFIASLQGCGSLEEEDEGVNLDGTPIKAISMEIVRALHSDARTNGYASDALVANTLVSIYGKLGAILEAQEVFCALPEHSVVSWTAMLSTYAEQNQGHKALQLFRLMQEENVSPNKLTFVAVLQACTLLGEPGEVTEESAFFKAKSLEIGQALHADACTEGYISDLFVSSTLLGMYGNCGSLLEAETFFNSLPHRHVDICNVILSLFVAHGEGEKALSLYRMMQQELVPLNYTTLNCLFQACSETAHLETCYELHSYILLMECDWIPSIDNTIIYAYGSSASMVDAQVVFDQIPEPRVGAWTSCITGYAAAGNLIGTLQMLENLQQAGCYPNRITLTAVLSACNRAGFVGDGIEHLMCMSGEQGLGLDLKEYSMVLDLLGRAGDFNRVSDILLNMPMQPDLSMWSCLIGVCRLHCHIELAKHAFEHILNLQPQHAAPYVLMSNMYAEVQHFAEVEELDIGNSLTI